MPGDFIFPEYLSANSVRAFPLSQSGTRLDTTNSIKLPDSLIVSAAINATPDYVGGYFYISSLVSVPDSVSVVLSYQTSTGETRDICEITANASHVENTAYPIVGTGYDLSVSGSITIGGTDDAKRNVSGQFDFLPSTTRLEADCIFISVPQVKYVEMFSGTTSIGQFSGVLKLRAGRNIRLRYAAGGSDVIIIDAIDGLNLTPALDECNQLSVLGPPILTINGIPPDAAGNFTIDGSECIEVAEGTNGLTITDTCASSCCGCTELDELLQLQTALELQVSMLKEKLNTVTNSEGSMIVNLVNIISTLQ